MVETDLANVDINCSVSEINKVDVITAQRGSGSAFPLHVQRIASQTIGAAVAQRGSGRVAR